MKKYALPILLALSAILPSTSVFAQNILTEGFNGTSLPTGWSNSTYTSPSTGCASTYGCAWYQETASVGTPGPAAHSSSGYMFYDSRFIDSGGTAELITPAVSFSGYTGGYNKVSFWMYRDNNGTTYYDSVTVYVNTTAGASGGIRLGSVNRVASHSPVVSAAGWYQYAFNIPVSFTGATNYIIFKAFSHYGYDMYLDDVSIDHIPACTGTPSITSTTPSGTITVCPGTVQRLAAAVPNVANLSYQWQVSYTSGSTWSNIAGDTDLVDSVFVSRSAEYRFIVKCNNSGMSDTGSPIIINISSIPKYAALPYTQDFESWSSRCDDLDIPDSSWTNSPASGNASWRRDDQGYAHGGWDTTIGGEYTPTFFTGSHSARFHNFKAGVQAKGELDLYVNCSGTTGAKELHYYFYNPDPGTDSMNVFVSVDSGATFTQVTRNYPVGEWDYNSYTINSNSPKTIIRFIATSDTINARGNNNVDIGLDDVQVVPPCTGKPNAGTIDSLDRVCASHNFHLYLSGTSAAAGLAYRWQQSTDSITWTDVLADTTAVSTTSINVSTYFRAIVKCRASGLADTSNIYLVKVKPFYYCYCNPMEALVVRNPMENIGNVKLIQLLTNDTIINNGIDTPIINNPRVTSIYSNFDTISPVPTIYRDSLYKIVLTNIIYRYNTAPGAPPDMVAWIDYNHDGIFDRFETVYINAGLLLYDTFHVQSTALLGITGMRIKLSSDSLYPVDACNPDTIKKIEGQYQDYLVNIDYRRCDGPVNAGNVIAPDSGACIGHRYMVMDTSHQHYQSGITWSWQFSGDSVRWYDVPGSTGRDTVSAVLTGSIWYRLRMICMYAHDTTYSDSLHIKVNPPYKCYCYSSADTTGSDTSDVGAFSINAFSFSKGGPHLHNGAAKYAYEDYTDMPVELWADSTYTADLYYILKGGVDAKAKVTLFMDFDNNHAYDVPAERVWSTIITPPVSYISQNITIPDMVVPEMGTGMRLIINNNTLPNAPSDDGCGSYTSGETVDFAVIFHKPWPNVVGTLSHVSNLVLYPNPTTGKCTMRLNASGTVHNLQVTVTDMTGRTILQKGYTDISGLFDADLDMSGYGSGMYFIEFTADGERMIRKLVVK